MAVAGPQAGKEQRLIAGLHAVRTALAHGAGSVREIWVEARRRDRRIRDIVQLARGFGIAVHQTDRDTLDAYTGGANHQGIAARVAVAAGLAENALSDLLSGLDVPPFLLILDGVQDPHNLGACLRTADAAGVHAVIAPRDKAVGLTPTACKIASGAAGAVPFVQVTNLVRTLRWLQDGGVWLVGTEGEAETGLYVADLRGPLGLVVGAEAKGMRRLTRETCDLLVSIPMAGVVESLNLSVATGIVLFEALRQRCVPELRR